MFYALDKYGNRVHVSRAISTNQYYCPFCHCQMIIKNKGMVLAHHFMHKTRKNCDVWYENKMSQWHCDMQDMFPENTREIVVHSEDKLEYHIADALLSGRNGQYVFEFQHSSISADEFILRSSFYLKLGYSLVWVFDLRDSQKPKCLFYEDLNDDVGYKHVVWPGKDRIRWLDSSKIRSFMLECLENNYNITILFHAYTGLGKQRMVRYPNGFESITWEYIETFSREEFFIRPNFSFENSLASFYARFFSREEIVKRIEELMK